VALGESYTQAYREGKVSRGSGGGGRLGASAFVVAEGGGKGG
jgi:hypothetical protein